MGFQSPESSAKRLFRLAVIKKLPGVLEGMGLIGRREIQSFGSQTTMRIPAARKTGGSKITARADKLTADSDQVNHAHHRQGTGLSQQAQFEGIVAETWFESELSTLFEFTAVTT